MDRLDFAEVKNTVGVVGTGLRPLPLGAAEEFPDCWCPVCGNKTGGTPWLARNYVFLLGAPLFPLTLAAVARCSSCGPVALRLDRKSVALLRACVLREAEQQPWYFTWWFAAVFAAAGGILGWFAAGLVPEYLFLPVVGAIAGGYALPNLLRELSADRSANYSRSGMIIGAAGGLLLTFLPFRILGGLLGMSVLSWAFFRWFGSSNGGVRGNLETAVIATRLGCLEGVRFVEPGIGDLVSGVREKYESTYRLCPLILARPDSGSTTIAHRCSLCGKELRIRVKSQRAVSREKTLAVSCSIVGLVGIVLFFALGPYPRLAGLGELIAPVTILAVLVGIGCLIKYPVQKEADLAIDFEGVHDNHQLFPPA